jgi:hypothetical protein
MLATSIQFIGIFVIIANTGGGLHILLPHFPGTPYATHTSAIQFAPTQVTSTNWPNVKPCADNVSMQCAPIDLETITFSGANDPPPPDVIGNIPRLRCCCSTMTDIQAKYKDPLAPDKVAAHIWVDKGVAEAIAAPNARVDTWVTMHTIDPAGITVTGSTSKTTFRIVFKAGAQFSILNDMPPTTPSHFLAYYLMGIGSGKCTAVPSAGPPCAPSATGCLLPNVSKSATKTVRPKTTKVAAATHRPRASTDSVDLDCSNSHWP